MIASSSLPKRDLDVARKVARSAMQIPRATYRIQLNKEFPFSSASEVVPYLAQLGVSHLYASPIFAAAPGSMHGYDVIDFSRINDELGGDQGFEALLDVLEKHGMGLTLDFVPNHMGVAAGANPWWQDVLENGQASPFAGHFDIDWQPLKPELQDQVLVPVLGNYFGVELERGELKLVFESGAFIVHYYSARLPIAPPTYPMILNRVLALAGPQFEPDALPLLELQSIIASFERLAPNYETDPERITERLREQVVGKHRLDQLVSAEPGIGMAVKRGVEAFNGRPGVPETFDDLESLLNAQSYRPAYWRVAAEEINYRRFFAINELAAIRQEVPGVFEESHRLLFELMRSGRVDGLRIDHPDGLWDPAGYFRDVQLGVFLARARAAIESRRGKPLDSQRWSLGVPELRALWDAACAETDPGAASVPCLYTVVEKILEHGESLPGNWRVAGTVGYEFARVVTGLFVDSGNRKALDDGYARFAGSRTRFNDLVYEQKKLIMREALASEVNVLARAFDRLTEHNRRTRDFTLNSLRSAMREIIACFPVYRTYTVCDGSPVSPRDRRFVESAVNDAIRRNPALDRGAFDFIRDALLLQPTSDATREQRDELCRAVMKFQQLTGPVMAKGLEDTAFYQYNRLLSLNEVGGDPAAFGVPAGDFHRQCTARANQWPHAMLASSTHDTKRSEDARARISAISEMPREWRVAVNRWARMNRRHKTRLEGALAPDRNDEYHLYQTLVGLWPIDATSVDSGFVERVQTYMIKAVREGQVHSSWINPNEGYEASMASFVDGLLKPARRNAFPEEFGKFSELTSRIGVLTSLSQQLLKLTAPGVPDIYQGTELWDFSLVDPDNRRAVDFQHRSAMLKTFAQRKPDPVLCADLLATWQSGAIKLYLAYRIMQHRAANAGLYARGNYEPLEVTGPLAANIIAFRRKWNESEVIVVAPRLMGSLLKQQAGPPVGSLWGGTRLALPDTTGRACFANIFSGAAVTLRDEGESRVLDLEQVLADLPVGLLHRDSE